MFRQTKQYNRIARLELQRSQPSNRNAQYPLSALLSLSYSDRTVIIPSTAEKLISVLLTHRERTLPIGGFEVNIAGHAAGGLATYLSEQNYGHTRDGKPYSLMAIPGLEDYWGTGIFATEALTQEAIKALDKAKKYNQPFLSIYGTLCHPRSC